MKAIDCLAWDEPKTIQTRTGPKQVKKASPSEEFWVLWRNFKVHLLEAGFNISSFGGKWTVNWWDKGGVFRYPVLPIEEAPPVQLRPMVLVTENDLAPEYRFQYPLIQYTVAAMDEYNASLDACGTGVGKTFITLYAAKERKRKLLVIGPKATTIKWQRAGFSVGVEIVGSYGWEWIKTGKTPFGHWEYINPKGKKKTAKRKKGDFVWTIPDDCEIVFDEAHRAAAADSDNAKIVVCARRQALPIHILSATIADEPMKMRAVGFVLGLHRDGDDFRSWMLRNGVKEVTIRIPSGKRNKKTGEEIMYRVKLLRFGGESAKKKEEARQHLVNIHRSIFPHKGVRVTAEELGAAFPPTQIIAEPYLMENAEEVNAIYREMTRQLAEIEATVRGKDKQANLLTAMLRARMKVELLKVPVFVSLTRDALAEGNSIFLPVNFKATMNELIAQLEIKAFIHGEQDVFERQNMIDAFQANEVPIITGIVQACREGIDLHDVHGGHPRLALISPMPSAFGLRQVLGRVHRVGGKSPSIQRIVYAANTIEEKVCKGLANRLDRLDLLMDGDLREGIFPDSYSDLRMDDDTELLAIA